MSKGEKGRGGSEEGGGLQPTVPGLETTSCFELEKTMLFAEGRRDIKTADVEYVKESLI